ncbi:DNA-binding IclR family transcriptional regulator [Halarchaeum rubridurum]|uniref:DNA-binding IclR family transcriptional regulator n=2 Tax=Halarchaeum rubridurum TaxID=489911 RepID=A0A8T4GPK9_9EURY|nr:IclR family transcriptional regulator [Halarchaeum rubridurum]MBP1954679.1 DNA-binding IclR family transcriptional regulator [Halarchaeum rubridurum]
MSQGTGSLKTVERAFDVVDVLGRLGSAGPAAVADELDVTRSTAHDYLVSLAEAGYVSREDGTYRLGYRFLQRGSRVKYGEQFFRASRAPLADLASETGEIAQIGVEEAGEWVLVHAEHERRLACMGPYPGMRTPLHTHAGGKVLLASLPEARRDRLLADPLACRTEQTTTDAGALRRELERIAEDGYATDADEQSVGIGFVACPVTFDGTVLGSVSVACPSGRLKRPGYCGELEGQLNAIADEISINYRELQHREMSRDPYQFE